MSPREGSGALARRVATLGGLGHFPRAPGTAASLAAVALYALLCAVSCWLPVLFLAILVPFAVWGAGKYAAAENRRDPPEIVVDEWVGQFVCLIGVAPGAGALAAGFLLFRAFDIIKLPIGRRLEKLPGGAGVVADDVAAGVMGRAALFGLSYLGVV